MINKYIVSLIGLLIITMLGVNSFAYNANLSSAGSSSEVVTGASQHAVIISTVTAVTPLLSTWYSTAIPAGTQWIDLSGGQGYYDYDVTSNPKIIYGYYNDQKIDLPASGATTVYYQQAVTTPNVQLKFKKWMN